jgi:hypothetical protein
VCLPNEVNWLVHGHAVRELAGSTITQILTKMEELQYLCKYNITLTQQQRIFKDTLYTKVGEQTAIYMFRESRSLEN